MHRDGHCVVSKQQADVPLMFTAVLLPLTLSFGVSPTSAGFSTLAAELATTRYKENTLPTHDQTQETNNRRFKRI